MHLISQNNSIKSGYLCSELGWGKEARVQTFKTRRPMQPQVFIYFTANVLIIKKHHHYLHSGVHQIGWRYKIYIEGNSWSVSEKYILACDSMALLVKPEYYDFFSRSMEPMLHYWPIRTGNKCRDIKFAVEWGNNHSVDVCVYTCKISLIISFDSWKSAALIWLITGTGHWKGRKQVYPGEPQNGICVRVYVSFAQGVRKTPEIQAKNTGRSCRDQLWINGKLSGWLTGNVLWGIHGEVSRWGSCSMRCATSLWNSHPSKEISDERGCEKASGDVGGWILGKIQQETAEASLSTLI